jgi:hypothetical protein
MWVWRSGTRWCDQDTEHRTEKCLCRQNTEYIIHHTEYIIHHTEYIIHHAEYIIHHTEHIIHPILDTRIGHRTQDREVFV